MAPSRGNKVHKEDDVEKGETAPEGGRQQGDDDPDKGMMTDAEGLIVQRLSDAHLPSYGSKRAYLPQGSGKVMIVQEAPVRSRKEHIFDNWSSLDVCWTVVTGRPSNGCDETSVDCLE